ncbi:MAG: T9SS type A sorting domain-containing protein, partial [Flavisolibacter sp.]
DMMMHVRRAGPNLTDSLWFFGGLSIENTSGDRYFDFELYQTDIYYDRVSQQFYGYGPDAGHTTWKFDAAGNILTPGDVIFSASYQSNVLTGIEARIWVDQASLSMTPASFNWAGTFDGAAVGSQYGYAGILPKTAGDFYTGLENNKTTWAGPFDLIRGDNSLVTDYLAGQFMEFSVNLTKLGLDPATILGGNICGSPFNRMVVKTRASASFTAALKDFVAPIDLFLAPRVDVLSDVPVLCATQSVSTITVQNPSNASVYSWSTANGHIVGTTTGTSIQVDQPGTYIVTQRLAAGCNPYAYDTLSINYDVNCKILASLVTDFRGNLADGTASLNWTTNYNDGIDYYELQRSLDGQNFESISTIPTKSTGGAFGNYSSADNVSTLNTPYAFYRLKIKLSAKSVVYSTILRLNLPIRKNEVLLYPNPVTDYVQVALSSDKKQDLKVLVYDLSGALIHQMSYSLVKGNNVFAMATAKWKPGTYVMQLVTTDQTIHKKLVKQVQSGVE